MIQGISIAILIIFTMFFIGEGIKGEPLMMRIVLSFIQTYIFAAVLAIISLLCYLALGGS